MKSGSGRRPAPTFSILSKIRPALEKILTILEKLKKRREIPYQI